MQIKDIINYNESSLKGKTALITGASAGIGFATACVLAAEGCNLKLVARREERLKLLVTDLLELFPTLSVDYIVADVRQEEYFTKLVNKNMHDVDILINNAGLAKGLDHVATANIAHWQEMIDTNVTAAYKTMHLIVPKMIAKGAGHIINISSIAGHEAYEKGSVYCATKHALIAFSRALRQEVCDKNIRITVVSPGLVNTEFSTVRFDGDSERAATVYKGLDPLLARDISHQILFALKQPAHVNVDEIFVTPTAQGSALKVHRV